MFDLDLHYPTIENSDAFVHNTLGPIPRISRHGTNIDHNPAFGAKPMSVILNWQYDGTSENLITDLFYGSSVGIGVNISPYSNGSNSSAVFNRNHSSFGYSKVFQNLIRGLPDYTPREFLWHIELYDLHEELDMSESEFIDLGVVYLQFKLYMSGDADDVYTEWYPFYTGSAFTYNETMSIHGPNEIFIEEGATATIDLTFDPGAVWGLQGTQKTSATAFNNYISQNFELNTYPDTFLDLYKPRGENYVDVNSFNEFADLGGAGALFIVKPVNVFENNFLFGLEEQFLTGEYASETPEFENRMYNATINGVWYGKYFESNQGSPVTDLTIEEIKENMQVAQHGEINLVDPQYGLDFGDLEPFNNYNPTDNLFTWEGMQEIAIAQIEVVDEESGMGYIAGINAFQYFGASGVSADSFVVSWNMLNVYYDSIGTPIFASNFTGIDVTDNFQLFSEVSTSTSSTEITLPIINYNNTFQVQYTHTGATGTTDKFYVMLTSMTGHVAIHTINVNIGISDAEYDDYLLVYDDDSWQELPDRDYDPTEEDISIERPTDIIYHLLDWEMGVNFGLNEVDMQIARNAHVNYDNSMYKMSFSIKDQTKGLQLITKIANQSYCIPTLLQNKLSIKILQKTYNGYEDNIFMIDNSDIINFNIDREPNDNIIARVKTYYDYNIISKDFNKSLPAVTAGQVLLSAYDPGYYNMEQIYINGDLEYDYTPYNLNAKLDLIKDESSALEWTVFKLLDRCQPHNIIKLELPLRFCYLEIGDIVQFPNGPFNNETIFGEDYTDLVIRNGQYILPLFYIHQVAIGTTIKIVARQIHHAHINNLQWQGQEYELPYDESFGWAGTNPDPGSNYNDGNFQYNPDFQTYEKGDITMDGVLNILDIVSMVSIIVDTNATWSDPEKELADFNSDGVVNILDVVMLVSAVIEGQ